MQKVHAMIFRRRVLIAVLLLCSTINIFFWVRSYRTVDSAFLKVKHLEFFLKSHWGRVQLAYDEHVDWPPDSKLYFYSVGSQSAYMWNYLDDYTFDPRVVNILGVGFFNDSYTGWELAPELQLYGRHAILIPNSYLLIGSLGFAALCWRRIRKLRKMLLAGRCQKCGYNLQAHSPGEKCPECGTVIPQPKAKAARKLDAS